MIFISFRNSHPLNRGWRNKFPSCKAKGYSKWKRRTMLLWRQKHVVFPFSVFNLIQTQQAKNDAWFKNACVMQFSSTHQTHTNTLIVVNKRHLFFCRGRCCEIGYFDSRHKVDLGNSKNNRIAGCGGNIDKTDIKVEGEVKSSK